MTNRLLNGTRTITAFTLYIDAICWKCFFTIYCCHVARKFIFRMDSMILGHWISHFSKSNIQLLCSIWTVYLSGTNYGNWIAFGRNGPYLATLTICLVEKLITINAQNYKCVFVIIKGALTVTWHPSNKFEITCSIIFHTSFNINLIPNFPFWSNRIILPLLHFYFKIALLSRY